MYRGLTIALIMLLVTTMTVLAAPAPKQVNTALIPSTAQTLNVGDTLDFEAITLKHGAHFSVEWQGAEGIDTILNHETGEYLSTATFTAEEAGEYTIVYTITMTAGKGQVAFIGTAVIDVAVFASPDTITGGELRKQMITPVINPPEHACRL